MSVGMTVWPRARQDAVKEAVAICLAGVAEAGDDLAFTGLAPNFQVGPASLTGNPNERPGVGPNFGANPVIFTVE